jgi:glycosyltransferase involved in cell wall biosynthesis/SAM-dependent methyltransferase
MTTNSLITAASFAPNLLQSPSAWLGHLPFAAWVIQEVSPKIFVELGTHYGHSYFSFCQSVVEAGLSTKCYAVDTWQGDEHAGKYNDEVFAKVNAHHQEHYAEFSQLLRMTFNDAASYFSDESIELLHIDGLHTYEAVRHDFETWLPKLAPGAVIMFHDTNVRERNFGVWKLWEELQAQYPNNLEFMHSHGLGVLQLNHAPENKKLHWLQPNSPEKQRLIAYFAVLGSRQLERFELNEIRQHASNLNQALSDRNGQIANLHQALSDRNGQIANLNQALSDRNGQIANLNQALSDRNGRIANLNQALSDRSGQITSFYNSSSWKITWPLRVVSHQIKRAKWAIELVGPAVRCGGDLQNSIRKALHLYSLEGLAGIKRGFRMVAMSSQFSSGSGSGERDRNFDRNDYAEWIHRYDTLNDETRATMHARIKSFTHKPLISVVMPTYNAKPEWLIEAIESVCKQIYPRWELCIADDASTDKAIRPILESYARKDSRIKVVFREQNGHISAASNSALELATGEWVALLDHDDLLSEHALFWVADVINQNPNVRLIYTDEDKIDEGGRRFNPYFKCDWNVDLFYSHNLITHLGVYRTDLLKDIGGFRVGLEGAQDYDLALRCVERIEPKQIHHIPRVLYHWRMHDKSTAQSADAKPYAMLAGEKALNEHIQRQKIYAKAELIGHGYRVRYTLPDTPPMVSLIIPTKNGLQLIRQCVESILTKTTYPNYEILIVDNGSDDPATLQYFDELRAEECVRVVRDDRPFNYSALNNAAVKLAQGQVLGLLNNDLEVISPEWLSEMVSIALQPRVGAVGARLWYPNETLQHGGVILGIGGSAGHSHKHIARHQYGYVGRASLIQSFSAVTAACLVIRKAIYEEVQGLNETDLQVAFNDVDFCLRVREAGYRNVWTPYAELYHHESATRGYENTPEKKERFAKETQYIKQRWGHQLLNDPAYSPNLTLNHEDFSLAWPPRVDSLSHAAQISQQPELGRLDKALLMIDRAGLGLEIGPSHNPIAPKKHGFNVHILDHANADELREKYKGHGVNLDNIEDVDFVWHGEPLHELVGREQCYDWIIASHVIEHTPDLITFLTECERLLKPSGVLSLIIPDKRYCFDYFNAPTSTGELLDAFEQRRKRPSAGKVFDHFSGAAKLNGHIAWGADSQGTIEFVHDLAEARDCWKRARITEDYIDVHNWRFTPSSFGLLLGDLQALRLTNFEIKAEFDTAGCEFYVTLGKSQSFPSMNRLLVADRMRRELASPSLAIVT